jgi:hypothetical protein
MHSGIGILDDSTEYIVELPLVQYVEHGSAMLQSDSDVQQYYDSRKLWS